MIKIINKTGSDKYLWVEALANDKLFSTVEKLKVLLASKDFSFNYTSEKSVDILAKIEKELITNSIEVTVLPWFPWNRWTSAIGYTKGGNTIYINMRKINALTKNDLAGNVIHEAMHLIGYSHGSNQVTNDKQFSVPYFFGNCVEGRMIPNDIYSK